MTVRAALVLLFVTACTHQSPAVADTVNAVDGSASDAGTFLLESAPATTPPDASATELAADGGLAALLSGAVPAARLPEMATEPGRPLDRELRERLTTHDAVDDALAAFGTERSVAVTTKSVSATSPMDDAERVVASIRPRARACYRLGMASDATMAGTLVIAARIGSSGEVADAHVAQNSGLSSQVAECVARAYRNATFSPPAGGAGATLTVTLSFASGS